MFFEIDFPLKLKAQPQEQRHHCLDPAFTPLNHVRPPLGPSYVPTLYADLNFNTNLE